MYVRLETGWREGGRRHWEDSVWGRETSTRAWDEPPPPGTDDTRIVFLPLIYKPLYKDEEIQSSDYRWPKNLTALLRDMQREDNE